MMKLKILFQLILIHEHLRSISDYYKKQRKILKRR